MIAPGTRIEVWCEGRGKRTHRRDPDTGMPIPLLVDAYEYTLTDGYPYPMSVGPRYIWQQVATGTHSSATRRRQDAARFARLENLDLIREEVRHNELFLSCRCGAQFRAPKRIVFDRFMDKLGSLGVSRVTLDDLNRSLRST